jgi:DNA-binding CsgD family transcriptional regulator
MGARNSSTLGEDFVRRAVENIDEAVRDAGWGRASWGEVGRRMRNALPDSAPTIVNYDLPANEVNTLFTQGVEERYVASYEKYYFQVNPWLDFWKTAPDGVVYASEREFPVSSLRDTEFFNDWLKPQEHLGAAVGIRIGADEANTVLISWHYDVKLASRYDEPAAEVLRLLKSRFVSAVETSKALSQRTEEGVRAGSLLGLVDDAALLIDQNRRIRDTNQPAQWALGAADVIGGAGNILSIRNSAAQRWLEENVARLVARAPIAAPAAVFSIEERVFRISLSLAPNHLDGGQGPLITPRSYVLVLLKLLVGAPLRLDHTGLRFAFGLSTAECRLCDILVNGHSLNEAARLLSVSDGTVRQRVKNVFQKTRTHRQGELVALLARFGSTG